MLWNFNPNFHLCKGFGNFDSDKKPEKRKRSAKHKGFGKAEPEPVEEESPPPPKKQPENKKDPEKKKKNDKKKKNKESQFSLGESFEGEPKGRAQFLQGRLSGWWLSCHSFR